MNVLVSGASGFIGRHVVAELERRDLAPTVLLRPGTEVPDFLRPHRVVRADLGDAAGDAHAAVFEQAGRPDALIHLAWGGLPNYRSPHHVERELPAQHAFLKSMVAAGLPRLVVSGTCFEYGMRSGALAEDGDAAPANSYALAKDTLRRRLQCLQREQPSFALSWARLFYLHGAGQAGGSLLPLLRAAAERGDAAFPMSGGEQLRDYLDVADAARHLVALALRPRGAGVVNVCSGRPAAVRSLVEGWIREHGWTIVPALGQLPYSDHEPMAFWGDRTRLDQLLATP